MAKNNYIEIDEAELKGSVNKTNMINYGDKKYHTIPYGILTGLLVATFIFVLYKVINVPITHDETATTVHYGKFGTWAIMMYPDNWPNNHILNTLLTKLFIFIFGTEQWVVRLPNVIGFLLYSMAIFRISVTTFKNGKSWLIIAAGTIFLCNPYLLDFFGLCRGYGLAAALTALSASFLLTGFRFKDRNHIWTAFFIAMLASYANFSTLVFWGSSTLLCAFYFFHTAQNNTALRNDLIKIGISSILYLALIAQPIIKMQSTNQFKYWTSKGFYEGTVKSLMSCWMYGKEQILGMNASVLSAIVLLLVIGATLYIIFQFFKKNKNYSIYKSGIVLSSILLWLTITVSAIQTLLLQTPDLSGRTAIFIFPLFSLFLVSLLGELEYIQQVYIKRSASIVLSIFLVAHMINTSKSKHVREWWFNENTLEVIEYLRKKHPDKGTSLNTHWMFHPSFYFYTETGHAELLRLEKYNKEITPETSAKYYYVFESDIKKLEGKFEKIEQIGWGRWLMKRIE